MTQFNTISQFLGLIGTLAVKTVKLRYKNSVFGFLWSMMNPMIYLIIFSVVFSKAFPGIDRYPLYALTGLIFWIYFSSSTIQIIESIINNAGVLKSINIPTIAFPMAAQLASLINLGFSLIPFTILMFVFGMKVTWATLLFFPILILFTGFTFGASIILSSLNVYFRDMQLAWSSFMPAVFYSSPIAYTANLIPAEFVWVVKLNPLFHFITALRDILYHNQLPSFSQMLTLLVLGTVPLFLGWRLFRQLERGFVSQF